MDRPTPTFWGYMDRKTFFIAMVFAFASCGGGGGGGVNNENGSGGSEKNVTVGDTSVFLKDGYVEILKNGEKEEAPSIADRLSSGVVDIFATDDCFAALKDDGSVLTWRDDYESDLPNEIAHKLSSDVKKITATHEYFSALKEGGSVVVWGCDDISPQNGGGTNPVHNPNYPQGYLPSGGGGPQGTTPRSQYPELCTKSPDCDPSASIHVKHPDLGGAYYAISGIVGHGTRNPSRQNPGDRPIIWKSNEHYGQPGLFDTDSHLHIRLFVKPHPRQGRKDSYNTVCRFQPLHYRQLSFTVGVRHPGINPDHSNPYVSEYRFENIPVGSVSKVHRFAVPPNLQGAAVVDIRDVDWDIADFSHGQGYSYSERTVDAVWASQCVEVGIHFATDLSIRNATDKSDFQRSQRIN